MERILSLVEHYGYLVVFFGVMLESTGVPIPGVLAQRSHLFGGRRSVRHLGGSGRGPDRYWVGREGGRPFVLR
jgi:hypothetical protein